MSWASLANEIAQAALIGVLFGAGVLVCKRIWWLEKRVRKLEAEAWLKQHPGPPPCRHCGRIVLAGPPCCEGALGDALNDLRARNPGRQE